MRKQKAGADTSASDLLKRAGIKLFATYGYEGTSVRMIAKEAGLSAGQITAHFGSKENLYHEIVMDIFMDASREYDPIIGEYEYLRSQPGYGPEDAWKLIERIVDTQISYMLNPVHRNEVKILNVQTVNESLRSSAKLVQVVKNKVEGTLADLLKDVFAQKRRLHVLTISRMINGAIVTFVEHADMLLDDVVSSAYYPESEGWMKEYIKDFVMDSLRMEAERK